MKTFTDYMREADALELPNLRGSLVKSYVSEWGGEKPPCCAIGGANVASGRLKIEHGQVTGWLLGRMPHWMVARLDDCPVKSCKSGHRLTPFNIIIHLFDDHEWSRTRIADWVDATFGRDHDESDWLPVDQAVPA